MLADLHRTAFVSLSGRRWTAADFAELLGAVGVWAAIVEDTETAACLAYALARRAGDEGELLSIAVTPEARRTGIAGDLMDSLEKWALERGLSRLILEVGESNRAARSLYQGLGFAEKGRRPRYYPTADGGSETALLLSKALTGAAP